LVKLIDAKFGLGTQEAIIKALYKDNFDIGSVTPVVMEAAIKGDRIARKILTQASSGLVDMIRVVLAKINKGKKRSPKQSLAMVGALLSNKNIYSQMVRSHIKKRLPAISVCEPESSPVVGAALMAIKKLNA
jgi:N-acetylglucosamine kinase-like BadF-type ATPase